MPAPKRKGAAKTATRKLSSRQAGIIHGWRSGLEESNGEHLTAHDIPFHFEQFKITYKVDKVCRYTPDFLLLDNFIIVETKGRFTPADRQKHKLIKAQYPDLDIRFVFSNPNARLNKGSPTTYGKWAADHGFLYAKQTIPVEWAREPVNEKAKAIILGLMT